MKNYISILILFTILLVSCSTAPNNKEQYIESYETFIQDIQKNGSKFSETEWEEKDAEFEKYSEEMFNQFQDEMSTSEQIKVGKYAAQYAMKRGAGALNDLFNNGEIEKAINEIKDVWNNELKGEFKSAMDEFKNNWEGKDGIKQELESKMSELENILKDEKLQADIEDKIDEVKDLLNDEEIKGQAQGILKEFESLFEKIEKKIEEK